MLLLRNTEDSLVALSSFFVNEYLGIIIKLALWEKPFEKSCSPPHSRARITTAVSKILKRANKSIPFQINISIVILPTGESDE